MELNVIFNDPVGGSRIVCKPVIANGSIDQELRLELKIGSHPLVVAALIVL
jgi:hypothetical protein